MSGKENNQDVLQPEFVVFPELALDALRRGVRTDELLHLIPIFLESFRHVPGILLRARQRRQAQFFLGIFVDSNAKGVNLAVRR
jgi:hypothetical protein